MASNSTLIKTLALSLAGAAVLLPNDAEACSEGHCLHLEGWESLAPTNAAAIPTDGVLVLQGPRLGYAPEQDLLDKLELTVTRDGQPIDGTIEAPGVRGALVWRPAAPLEPGEYDVVGSFDNPDDEEDFSDCRPDLLQLSFNFTVEAGVSAPLSPPPIDATPSLRINELEDLKNLVCCDGAMPFRDDLGCTVDFSWAQGHCATRKAFGSLHVDVEATVDLPPATAALVVRELLVDGQPLRREFFDLLSFIDDKPFCTAIRLTNIATGESVDSEELCHGSDVAAQLGEHVLDPGPVLAQECSQAAYTCELAETGEHWDPERCTPWPGDEATSGDPPEEPTTGGPGGEDSGDSGDSEGSEGSEGSASGGANDPVDIGCGCNSSAPDPWGALALLGLGLLRPRRRPRA
jgi:MYXO-CTERM domain-containing protein